MHTHAYAPACACGTGPVEAEAASVGFASTEWLKGPTTLSVLCGLCLGILYACVHARLHVHAHARMLLPLSRLCGRIGRCIGPCIGVCIGPCSGRCLSLTYRLTYQLMRVADGLRILYPALTRAALCTHVALATCTKRIPCPRLAYACMHMYRRICMYTKRVSCPHLECMHAYRSCSSHLCACCTPREWRGTSARYELPREQCAHITEQHKQYEDGNGEPEPNELCERNDQPVAREQYDLGYEYDSYHVYESAERYHEQNCERHEGEGEAQMADDVVRRQAPTNGFEDGEFEI